MARPRTIPDTVVHDAVLQLLRHGSGKAVTFAAVAEKVGLAASSLAERYGTVAGMIHTARLARWQRLEAATDAALLTPPADARQVLALLKTLGQAGSPDLAIAPERAEAWRTQVLFALTQGLGGGSRAREAAGVLFLAWQGQALWRDSGLATSRLKEVLRALGY